MIVIYQISTLLARNVSR